MCLTSQRLGYPSRPAHRPTVAKVTGFKRRLGSYCRLQLQVSSGFTSVLVLGMPCSNSAPTSKPSQPQEACSLGQSQ
jgi:hypothetical protein